MNKVLTSMAVAALLAGNALADITPTRVGPVSQYGQLIIGQNSAGKGRIYGSCQGVQDGAEVQVKGMSLYWSLLPEAVEFWSASGVSTMVNDMNIQIIRASMATGTEDWSGGYKGYASDPTTQKALVSAVVEAAIANDIYVIIDWHSHEATTQTESAKSFFNEMAKKYGKYDNVIFEVFNEPTDIPWSQIQTYANAVIPSIRQYSDNLILVGTRAWDQHPEEVIGNKVTDTGKNTAYTLHFYANSHCWSGSYDWGGSCEGTNGLTAMNAGLSVFVSEWGTGDSDGGGTPDVSRNKSWQDYMDENKLSWANWSASKISEGTAAFTSGATSTSLKYSTSGELVKGYLASNPTSYTACATNVPTSSSDVALSSSSAIDGIAFAPVSDKFGLNVQGNKILLTSATAGEAKIEIFDLMGHAQSVKVQSIASGTNTIDLQGLSAGTYLVRVRQGSNLTQVKFQAK